MSSVTVGASAVNGQLHGPAVLSWRLSSCTSLPLVERGVAWLHAFQ
jgi:hypothetical protein